jgi:hypothetical protein
MDDINEWFTVQEKEGIVVLHASGLSQQQTAEELHHRHPNKPCPGQNSVGQTYL